MKRQYDTSKFEEALKDLDHWGLLSDELDYNGIPERVRVKDKVTDLVFTIRGGLIWNDIAYILPINERVVSEFKEKIYSKKREQKIMEVLSKYA